MPGVALPWLFFGHSNHVYTEDVPLSVRFTQRAPRLVCSKTMFLCSQVYAHPHAHYPRYRRFGTRSKEQYIAIGTDPAKNKLPIYERHQARIRPQHLLPVELSEAMVFHFFNKAWTRLPISRVQQFSFPCLASPCRAVPPLASPRLAVPCLPFTT